MEGAEAVSGGTCQDVLAAGKGISITTLQAVYCFCVSPQSSKVQTFNIVFSFHHYLPL